MTKLTPCVIQDITEVLLPLRNVIINEVLDIDGGGIFLNLLRYVKFVFRSMENLIFGKPLVKISTIFL